VCVAQLFSQASSKTRAKVLVVDYIGQTWQANNGSTALYQVMPAAITFLQSYFFLWSTLTPWTISSPLRRADECSGYKANNVRRTDSGITADLTLAASACNIHGQDLEELKFIAQYQTGALKVFFVFNTRSRGKDQYMAVVYYRIARPAPCGRVCCSSMNEVELCYIVGHMPFVLTDSNQILGCMS
jgi:hypothetical protein